MLRRMSRLGLGVALALATFGCAQEREPISRVQPNALKKSFFVGDNLQSVGDDPTFYYRGSVVDTGYGAGQDGLFTSTYAQPISRIRWQINENMIVARLAYERVENTDGKGTISYVIDGRGEVVKDANGNPVPTVNDESGQVVAAFNIQSHFDIRRSYNPVTGEEQNVVEENSSDRPWYEREFMRVDWSRNMVTNAYDFDTLSMMGVFGGVQYEPMSYYVNDPTSPDAPVFGDGYFDLTQKVFATPQMVNFAPELAALFGVSSFPACMLDADIGGGSGPTTNCNPQELKLRLSFRRVDDHKEDYEAQDWDGVRFQAFGAFTLNNDGRLGYARPYGVVDSKTHRFIERYNIWNKSHYYSNEADPNSFVACGTADTTDLNLDTSNNIQVVKELNADTDNNGTADVCQAVADATGVSGSKCDPYAKKCTLPFRKRSEKPVVWYHLDGTLDPSQSTQEKGAIFDSSAGGGADGLFQPTDWATQEWDVAMRSAVMTSRLVECRAAGDADCDSTYPIWHGQMDDQEDAIRLAREVNFCRRGVNQRIHAAGGKVTFADLQNQCNAVADDKAGQWGISDVGVIEMAKQPNAVILCHSPVIDSDYQECFDHFSDIGITERGGMFARLGDLRFNVVNTINTPQTPSAWGIMVDAKDPLDGHNVSSSINIWNHVTDIASQSAVDMIRYINGELTTAEITEGKFIKDWVLANEGTAGGSKSAPALTKDEVIDRIAGAASSMGKPVDRALIAKEYEAHLGGEKLTGQIGSIAAAAKQKLDKVRATPTLTNSSNAASIQAKMDMARGTDFEAQLTNGAMLESIGIDTSKGGLPDQATSQLASPLRGNNPAVISRIKQMRNLAMAQQGGCIIEAAPEFSGIIGLADIMKQKFPIQEDEDGGAKARRVEAMRRYIARRYQYGVLIHEMGHSFGERHNFVSSYDALNFRPQYWQLRTKNGTVTTACTKEQTTQEGAANCVGPRYFDPLTQEETDGLQWMWQQSSVMDYPGDITLDTLGLGGYDFAAARMFYGETTSVYAGQNIKGNNLNAGWVVDTDGDGATDTQETDVYKTDPNDPKSRPTPKQVAQLPASAKQAKASVEDITQRMDQFGGILGLQTGSEHYSQHQKNYNLIQADTCVEVDPQAYIPADWNGDIDGAFHNTLDARVVAVDGSYKRCRQQPVDYATWNSLRPVSSVTDSQSVTGDNPPAVDPSNRIRVPYPFASDNWADTGNVSVYRHDQGADPYEQYMFWTGSQENRFIFDHYRRNRKTFAIRPTMGRDWERYSEKMMNSVKGLGLYRNLFNTDSASYVWPGFLARQAPDNILAASLAMDHFSRQLTRPQDGDHYVYDVSKMWTNADAEEPILRSAEDGFIIRPDSLAEAPGHIYIPTGSSGYVTKDENGKEIPTAFRAVSFGGQPVNNTLDQNQGDYSSSYQLGVGSYYSKIYAVMALTESRDNFISASRGDFVDARYRATSIADVFPEGFRRLVGAALADDKALLGPRVAGSSAQLPVVNYDQSTGSNLLNTEDQANAFRDFCSKNTAACVTGEGGIPYPKQPMAWTSWWRKDGPATCWTTNGSQICATPEDAAGDPGKFAQSIPADSIAVDPEIGWEVQKYIIAWTYLYLPENQNTYWFDMMRIYRADYAMADIEGPVVRWRNPISGQYYVAKSYGTETLNGKVVEMGIGARVLQRANELTAKAYEVESTDPDTREVKVKMSNGLPIERALGAASPEQTGLDNNPYIQQLKSYKSIPDFMVQAARAYGLTAGDSPRGVY